MRVSDSRIFTYTIGLLTGTLALFLIATTATVATSQTISFNRDIRPILSENCWACHGPDAGHREADLRLDTSDGAAATLVAGKPEESELYLRLTEDDDSLIMPPVDSNKKLTPEQIELMRRWIEQGAPFETHWSFVTPEKPPLPPEAENFSNPIDAFLAATLHENGLAMSPKADRRILIRRVAFALTGFPPTLNEVNQFLDDPSPDAYEKMVDRYLASVYYGEEMARHWLDLARYGDTHGLHLDNERQMWAYRDWVVDRFNQDQPFDQFTIEQLAGDLLPEATLDQLTATGFNRCNVTTSEGGAIDDEFRYRYAVDRTNAAVQIWTGLTAECAACHDHKFDPVSIKEYYSLYAFFNSAADPPMDGNALLTNPTILLPTDEQKTLLADFVSRIGESKEELDRKVADYQYVDPATAVPPIQPESLENVWMDDEFPKDGQVTFIGPPTEWVSLDMTPVCFSGHRVLKRTATEIGQDVYHMASVPLMIPTQAKFFVEVWLESTDLPKAIMLQFHREGWNHRAVWGDANAIHWGKPNSPERHSMGDMPVAGQWVHLEIPAEQVGLKAGDAISGFALTQYGGTVYWDKLGVSGISDPTQDPAQSFSAWLKQPIPKDLPRPLKELFNKAQQAGQADQVDQASPSTSETGGNSNEVAVSTEPPAINPLDEQQPLLNYWLKNVCVQIKPHIADSTNNVNQLQKAHDDLQNSIPRTFIYRDTEKPRDSFVMKRGQYNEPGEPVSPNVPAFLPQLDPADPQRPTRLDFAKWLLRDDHPLTSRVIVNRYWQQFFGTGLVKSSGDFGSQGELPSHPELLDWLAVHFRESGWQVKDLVRMMLTSEAFQQSSRVTPELLAVDPENRLLGRSPRFRLDAEQIRDNALFVSGLIHLERGGRGVRTYQPPNVWEPVGYVDSNTRNYKQDSGPSLYRRSLYTFLKRTAPPPFMDNFDAPNREQFCTRRERSNTPLQALQLMNDIQHIEAARALAERIMKSTDENPVNRVRLAFEVVLSRAPEDVEAQWLVQQFESHLQRFRETPDDGKKLIETGESVPDTELDVAELAAWTLVANTILNLDETLNRN